MLAPTFMVAMIALGSGFAFAQTGQDDNYLSGTTQPAVANINQSSTENHTLSFGLVRASTTSDTLTSVTVRNQATGTAAGSTDFDQLLAGDFQTGEARELTVRFEAARTEIARGLRTVGRAGD